MLLPLWRSVISLTRCLNRRTASSDQRSLPRCMWNPRKTHSRRRAALLLVSLIIRARRLVMNRLGGRGAPVRFGPSRCGRSGTMPFRLRAPRYGGHAALGPPRRPAVARRAKAGQIRTRTAAVQPQHLPPSLNLGFRRVACLPKPRRRQVPPCPARRPYMLFLFVGSQL